MLPIPSPRHPGSRSHGRGRRWGVVLAGVLAASVAGAAGWPDLMRPVRSGKHAPQDAAVVIGVESYRSLPVYTYASRDADAFYQWLVFTRGVPPNRVARLIDPTRTRVAAEIEDAARDVGPDGVLWVYFSGHALASNVDGRHVLLSRDDEPEGEALRVDALEAMLEQSQAAHALMVIDAGFGGVGREGEGLMDARRYVLPPPAPPRDGRVATWIGTGPREIAGAFDQVRQGMFTYHVLGALQGWADGVFGEADGQVTLEEAQTWVQRRMQALSWPQTPTIDPRPSARSWVVAEALRPEPDFDKLPVDTPPFDALLAEVEAEGEAEEEADDGAWAEQEIRAQVQKQADADWARTYAYARSGSKEGLDTLRLFIARYAARTYLWNGEEIVVSASQIPEARRLLANGGKLVKPLIDTVRVEAGRFALGSPAGTPGRHLDETLHEVRLTRDLEVAVTEVTQAQFTTVMGVAPSTSQGDRLPVEHISWLGAIAFCNALSELEGYTKAYSMRGRDVVWNPDADGWRLPTEAEWSWAAGSQTYAGTQDVDGVCAHANVRDASLGGANAFACDDGHEGVATVRAGRPNMRGLYGMTGNVAEWVWDAYTAFGPDAVTDPAPDKPRRTRVVKGGSYLSGITAARLARREGVDAGERRDDLGFRVVRNADARKD